MGNSLGHSNWCLAVSALGPALFMNGQSDEAEGASGRFMDSAVLGTAVTAL